VASQRTWRAQVGRPQRAEVGRAAVAQPSSSAELSKGKRKMGLVNSRGIPGPNYAPVGNQW
jgi:hypothetical protein